MPTFLEKLSSKFGRGGSGAKDLHFVVIPKLKIAFGRVPKVANSSIKAALARHVEHDENGPIKPTRDRFWIEATDGRTTMLSPENAARTLEGFFIFAFTRNPFDRLVSCYNNKIVQSKTLPDGFARLGFTKNMSFDGFAARVSAIADDSADTHFQSQSSMLTFGGHIVPSFVGRFENLADDWLALDAALEQHAGIRIGRLEKRNYRRGDTDDLRDYYASNETFALVRQRYADDFRLFYPDVSRP